MILRPPRWANSSACRSSNCKTPAPTVPRPAMASFKGGFTTAIRERFVKAKSRRKQQRAPGSL
jgi:hypothetical protein